MCVQTTDVETVSDAACRNGLCKLDQRALVETWAPQHDHAKKEPTTANLCQF